MNDNDYNFDFDKSVSNAHLLATGWQLDQHMHSNPFECHAIYIRDYRSMSLNLVTINKMDFKRLDPKKKSPMEALAFFITETVGDDGVISNEDKKKELLAPALIAYIKGTGAYKIWLQGTERDSRLHVVLNIYRDGAGESLLRPAIINCPNTFVEPKEVIELSVRIKEMDKKNHPEWFN